MSWFECKVKFDKMMDDGIQKTVTEAYLVDALSFTEAEARSTEEMQSVRRLMAHEGDTDTDDTDAF